MFGIEDIGPDHAEDAAEMLVAVDSQVEEFIEGMHQECILAVKPRIVGWVARINPGVEQDCIILHNLVAAVENHLGNVGLKELRHPRKQGKVAPIRLRLPYRRELAGLSQARFQVRLQGLIHARPFPTS